MMKGSGWRLEIADDGTRIFSRSRDSLNLKENSAESELIMDDKDDTTLNQLATCQTGNNNDVTTGVFSTNDCSMKNSVEADKLNDDTNYIKEDGNGCDGRKSEQEESDVDVYQNKQAKVIVTKLTTRLKKT